MTGDWNGIDRSELGWHGTSRIFLVAGLTSRLTKAIAAKASELGISEVRGLPGCAQLQVTTGTPVQHQAADKLIAYVEGMSDVLSGEYGRQDEPVQVRRSDLAAAVAAFSNGFYAGPPIADVVTRLREALCQ